MPRKTRKMMTAASKPKKGRGRPAGASRLHTKRPRGGAAGGRGY